MIPPCVTSTPAAKVQMHASMDIIQVYFNNFERLAREENWTEIIVQGGQALIKAQAEQRLQDEAKISAQLTSTYFYKGDYPQALTYAQRCHALSKEFEDITLYLRALYLESAVHRALAGKEKDLQVQQHTFAHAVNIAQQARDLYLQSQLINENLKGKIYFNLGAAYADNPQGNLEEAEHCYSIAIASFQFTNAQDDVIRTSLRLGKIQFLHQDYLAAQRSVDDARRNISTERIAMQADYLEAQIKFAQEDNENAMRIARNGLSRAQALGANEDTQRFTQLIQKIDKSIIS